MTTLTILISTWDDGLFVVTGTSRSQTFPRQCVRGLATDGRGSVIFIVDGHAVCRRARDGSVTTIATSDRELACGIVMDDVIFVGTEDAHLLRLTSDGRLDPIHSFDEVAGRETWYAGAALIDGKLVGPPLGVRSMSATSDGATLLVNVHVGGIPRSTDGGASWHPTIDIHNDVHEVCEHPMRPELVAAAAASGLCLSRDGGATWSIEQAGLHGAYCSAVSFIGDDVIVSASADHFSSQGAVYRRAIDGEQPLVRIDGGLPSWTNGIVDTGCISVLGSTVAVVDRSGALYMSTDAGQRWERVMDGFPTASGVLVC